MVLLLLRGESGCWTVRIEEDSMLVEGGMIPTASS